MLDKAPFAAVETLAVIGTLALLGLSPAEASSSKIDKDEFSGLVTGVTEVVSPGAPGAVIGSSADWQAIVSGDDDTNLISAFVIARQFGSGRVIAMGHDGLPTQIGELDNRVLMNNVIDWLSPKPDGAVRYTTGHSEWLGAFNLADLGTELGSRGYSFEGLSAPLTPASLAGIDVLFVGNGWGSFSDSEIDAIEDFAESGGGVFLAGLGWSWPNEFENYPMNRVGAPFGVRWVRNTINDPSDQLNGSPILSTFYPEAAGGSIDGAQATIRNAHADFPNDLPQRLASDETLRRAYGQAHLLLSELLKMFPVDSAERQALDAFHRDLISGALGVDASAQLGKLNSYPAEESYMAYLRERFYITWLESLELTPERITQVAALGGFPAPYEQILATHQIYLMDNTSLSPTQLGVIDRLLILIDSDLHNLRFISVRDLLGEQPPEIRNFEMFASLAGGVNIFGIEVGGAIENSFPEDVDPGLVDVFTIALAHEVNHVVDAWTLSNNPILQARKDALVAAAGPEPLNYLRSQLPPGFFVNAPQEFIASISNQWFADSAKVFELGFVRFDAGRPHPLNQAVFFADLYSQGTNQTVFYVSDTSGQLTSEIVPLGRNGAGHIDQITVDEIRYDLTLDGEGNVLSYVADVPPPVAAFSWSPQTPQAGEDVQFTDGSTGAPTSWNWSFGDGTTSSEQNPIHRFDDPGSFDVQLTVTNPGGSSSITQTVVVDAIPPPVAAFSWSPQTPRAGEDVQFTDGSTGDPTAWSWSFGDGTTSNEQNPTHRFDDPGSFEVRLTVTNPGGSSSITQTVVVDEAGSCSSSPTALCLNGRRFESEVTWRNFLGETGSGRVVPASSVDSGLFWFFSAENWEMLIKVLDGCGFNDRFWVFAASTTNVEYTLRITDTETGVFKEYFNQLGNEAPAIVDTDAFATCSARQPADRPVVPPLRSASSVSKELKGAPGTCLSTSTNLCLNRDRFQVEVEWTDFEGTQGIASVVPFGSADSGLLWFFAPDNWEMLIKVLDGCGFNDRYWVFAAATTNVEYTLRVTDTETGVVKEYFNALGQPAVALTDTGAFSTCP